MKEVYVSTDVESDGPIPIVNSMLSFASVALDSYGNVISEFESNLETLPGAVADADTARWWKTQPEAWAACRENLQRPKETMLRYAAWLKDLPGKPVFVGYPAGFDFTFVYVYLMKFAGESPFSFAALDMKTLAMAILKLPFRETTKKKFPKSWIPKDKKHTHRAIDDAREQGEMFINMLRELEDD